MLAANLLCRVPNPEACLQEIDSHLAPGGVLVLTSPFTWLEEYTDKQLWIGGTHDSQGKPVRCADKLKQVLCSMGYKVLEEGKVCEPCATMHHTGL